jgi:hypothetical protein
MAPFAMRTPGADVFGLSGFGLAPGKPTVEDDAEGAAGLLNAGGATFCGGRLRFVDKLIISLPCTTRLSFDFLRSRVSISMTLVSALVL